MVKYVRKRNGKLEQYDLNRISKAIWKASQAVGNESEEFAHKLALQVDKIIQEKYGEDGVPTVEEIQDIVERVLIRRNLTQIAKAYIIYRHQHKELREMIASLNGIDLVDQYLNQLDWQVRENSNRQYSLQGLNNYVSSEITKNYWLNKLYPKEAREAHLSGDFHIHNLNMLSVYCQGHDLYDFLATGFRGVKGRLTCSPPKHLRTAVGQLVNFIFTMSLEAAGAQAVSNLDTFLAPYVRYDHLSYKEVYQCIQELIFNLNVPTRTSGETPFSNITLDLRIPDYISNMPGIVAGEPVEELGDFQEEADMINKALFEVYYKGDAIGRVFTFPIPTYDITKDFDWDNELYSGLWDITAKYGIPYFSNYINSDMKPEDARSMCCHLNLDLSVLKQRGGGYFGAYSRTGSIGVVTINMPRIGLLSKDDDQYFERLEHLMNIAKTALEVKRKVLEKFTERGLYPYTKFYLRDIKNRSGYYWSNHFSTIGLVGMNESLLNFMDCNIATKEGVKFTLKVLDFMRDKLLEFQQETGNLYNLEATPAEGCSYRLALLDQKKFSNCHFMNGFGKEVKNPIYTNSTQLPPDYTDDLFEALELQEEIQTKYTGGTVFHVWLGEKIYDSNVIKLLIQRIFTNFRIPYLTITPTFSICPTHGYLSGEVQYCPKCGSKTEVYSRVVGYLRPVDAWHYGKQDEFRLRKTFKV